MVIGLGVVAFEDAVAIDSSLNEVEVVAVAVVVVNEMKVVRVDGGAVIGTLLTGFFREELSEEELRC